MFIYSRKIFIETTQEELYDFHTNFENVKIITPKDITVDIIQKPEKFKEGEIIKVKSKKLFVSQEWEVVIDKLEENERIIDIAIKSPFKYWKHEHIFRKTISGVELIDKLEIELPFGFLNKLAEPIFFFVIDNMFYTRQKLTKEYMENRKNEK